jgi:hypothetical protein
MTKYNSNFEGTRPFSDTTVRFQLATNTAQSFTVPGDATQKYKASFKYTSTSNVFIGLNKTATVVGAGTKESTTNIEFRPDERYVSGGDVLSVITPDAAGAYAGVTFLLLTA